MGSEGSAFKAEFARGHVETEYTFWCGCCVQWERFTGRGTLKRTQAAARARGWRYARIEGWICPRHPKRKA